MDNVIIIFSHPSDGNTWTHASMAAACVGAALIALELKDEINLMLIDHVSYYLMRIIVIIVMT